VRTAALLGLSIAATVVLAACGASHTDTSAASFPDTSTPAGSSPVSSPPAPSSPAASSPGRRSHQTPFATKVLVVIEENHSLDQMRSGMPFLSALSDRYGYATDWHALAHPSEPNYLGIVGGSMFGVTDDEPPAVNAASVGGASSVFTQAREAGRTAGTYAESMPSPCSTVNSYPYAVRHNPWTYFTADQAACVAHDVSTTTFLADARHDRLPDVGLLIPDLLHDAHDGSLAAADTWLRLELPPVLASDDFTSGRLVVVVTADEDDRQSGNTVLTSVLSSRLDHAVVDTPLTHYSLTRFIAQVLRVRPLGSGADAPDLAAAFGL
jgi:hypothetical protein